MFSLIRIFVRGRRVLNLSETSCTGSIGLWNLKQNIARNTRQSKIEGMKP